MKDSYQFILRICQFIPLLILLNDRITYNKKVWHWKIDFRIMRAKVKVMTKTSNSALLSHVICLSALLSSKWKQWLGRSFCQMGHFQLFSMILTFSMGHFLSYVKFSYFLHRLLWAIFQVNGTMAHDPLPSQSLWKLDIFWYIEELMNIFSVHHLFDPTSAVSTILSWPLSKVKVTIYHVPTPVVQLFSCD